MATHKKVAHVLLRSLDSMTQRGQRTVVDEGGGQNADGDEKLEGDVEGPAQLGGRHLSQVHRAYHGACNCPDSTSQLKKPHAFLLRDLTLSSLGGCEDQHIQSMLKSAMEGGVCLRRRQYP